MAHSTQTNLPDRDWEHMSREAAVRTAAGDLTTELALLIGQAADHILGRPQLHEDPAGHAAALDAHDTPAGRAQRAEWHLVKMQIERELGLDHTGNVLNARHYGASWHAIATACGITRQAAHDRWAALEGTLDDQP